MWAFGRKVIIEISTISEFKAPLEGRSRRHRFGKFEATALFFRCRVIHKSRNEEGMPVQGISHKRKYKQLSSPSSSLTLSQYVTRSAIYSTHFYGWSFDRNHPSLCQCISSILKDCSQNNSAINGVAYSGIIGCRKPIHSTSESSRR